MAIEINTRFLYRDNPDDQKKKYSEALSRMMRKAHDKGVGIAVGSAAHSPKDQGNGFDVVLALLDACKINEVVFPVGGRLARVVLRATREHIEQHEKRRETVNPGSSITGFSRAELGLPEEAPVPARGRAARAVGPKKRTADATRAGKRLESGASTVKSTSKRTAESSTSSSKAKAARTKPETPPPPKKAAAPKAAPAKAAPKVKAVKTAPVKAVKAKAVAKPAVAKPAAKKPAAAKPAPKIVAKKAVTAKAPVKKVVVKKAAVSTKKAAPKKPAAAKPAAKKPVVKSPAKPKKLAAKPAAKPVAKKAAKKVAKPAAKRR
jgi:hypothetical protein